MSTRPAYLPYATVTLFVVALCAPLIGTGLGVARDPALARFEEHPDLHWSWRPRQLMRTVQDARSDYNTGFTFRDQLIRLHALVKLDVFGVSSSPRVTLGRDGWLFYAGEQIVADYQRVRPFSQVELEQWTSLLEHRKAWLAKRGIPFVFVIAPNPQTIYPENMPTSMWRAANPSRMDQLIDHLRATSDVDVIDVRPALIEAKQKWQVVYKTDTHWNQLGGFIAYEQLARWLSARFPQLDPLAIDELVRSDEENWHGGLSYFLGKPGSYSETRPVLSPREPSLVLSDGRPLGDDELTDAWFRRRRVRRESPLGEIDAALVLRDSQFAAPGQFLSRHFKHMLLVWSSRFDPSLVEDERPNVVIFEIAERLLMDPVPQDPPLP